MKKICIAFLSFFGIIGLNAQTLNLYSFKVKDIDGKDFDMANLKGSKVLIVNTASD